MDEIRKQDESPELRYDPQQYEKPYKEIFQNPSKPLLGAIQAIGDYLGKGDHSYIFKGQMVGSKRALTVKVDMRPLEEDANYNAIQDEVSNLKELHHPGIAELMDFIPDWDYVNPKTGKQGRSFIIMQYIPGKSLNQVLVDEGRPRQKRVLNWTIQLLGVLRYLHRNQRIAGRIAPSNLVLGPRDRISMVDFEYIDAFSNEIREEKPQSRFIRPSAPEELQAGILSDIQSLGTTMFKLLTGKAWNPDNANANDPLFEDANVSPSVRDVIRKALASNPADRYQSAQEMEWALRYLPYQDARFIRHVRRGGAAAILCAFLLVLGGFYYVTGQSQLNRTLYMEVNAAQASDALRSGDYTNALRFALETTDRTGFDPPVTANAQTALADALGVYNGVSGYQPFRSDFKLRGRPLKALFSPEGRTFAVLVEEASAYVSTKCLQIFDAESGTEIAPFLSVRNADNCAFLFMDDDTLLYTGEDGLTFCDLKTGTTSIWDDAPSSNAQTGLALSADGKVAAYAVWETGTAYIFDAQTQTLTRILSLSETSDAQQTLVSPMEHMAALDAAGRFLAVSLPGGGIGLFPTDGSEPTILSQTSPYRHFEGGFFAHFFFYAASNAWTQRDSETFTQTECRLIDLDTRESILELQEPTLIHAQADENGIYLSIGNELYRVDADNWKWEFLADAETPIQSLRHAAGRLLITTAAGQTLVYRDDGAGRTEITARGANFSIAELSKNYVLLGRSDKSMLSLLKWRKSGGDILTYSDGYPHFGAYVHSDKQTVMLFNVQSFRVYDVRTGEYWETELDEPSQIYNIAYLRRRTAVGDPEEECLKVTYRDAVRFYSAKTGKVLSDFSREPYESDADELTVFITEHYRLEQATGDAIVIEDTAGRSKRVDEGILMDATELDSRLILFLRGFGEYDRYALALDSNLDVMARIPRVCDALPDGTLIFDDNQGHLLSGRLYSVEELRTLAKDRLNGE